MTLRKQKSDGIEEIILQGSIDILKQIIQDGEVDVNSLIQTGDGDVRLLSAAVINNQLEVSQFLLSNGANPNLKDEHDNTPLFWSCQSNVNPKIMKLLIDHNANVNAVNASDFSVFERLLESFDTVKAELLYEADISPSITRKTDESILHKVIRLHQHSNHILDTSETPVCFEVFKKVVELGADINLCDSSGKSILLSAILYLCYDTVEFILQKGCRSIDSMCGDYRFSTPLLTLCLPTFQMKTSSDPHPFRNIRFILEGTHQKVKYDEDQLNKIEFYIESTVLKTAEILIKYGADVNIKDSNGDTSLHLACSGRRFGLVELLIKHGANVNDVNLAGRTPILCFLSFKPIRGEHILQLQFDKQIRFLIEAGADPNITCSRGWNALLHAVFQRLENTAEYFLSLNLDVNFKDGNGLSALHIACSTGKLEMINMLIEHGADIRSKDIYGGTPLFYAVGPNFEAASKILLDHGASIDHLDNQSYDVTKYRESDDREGLTRILNHAYHLGWLDHPVNFDEIENVETKNLGQCLAINEVDGWLASETWLDLYKEKIIEFLKPPFISESEEYRLIVKNAQELLLRISERMKKLYPDLSFTPLLSGSVSEGTKISYPNEFDFLICLDHFHNVIDTVEEDCPPSHCKVHKKTGVQNKTYLDFFKTDGSLIPSKLTFSVYKAIRQILSSDELWRGLGLYWGNGPSVHSNTIDSLEVYWVGSTYKFLPVSIDLVIAFAVPSWWPKNAARSSNLLVSNAEKEGGLLVVKRTVLLEDDFLRVSFSKVETKIMRDCADVFRKGYMLAKAMRMWFPNLWVQIDAFDSDEEDEEESIDAESLISSYILKTSLFRQIEHNSDNPPLNAVEVAFSIWQHVAESVANGFLPSFFINDYRVYELKDPDLVLHNNGYPDEHTKTFSRMIASVLNKMKSIDSVAQKC